MVNQVYIVPPIMPLSPWRNWRYNSSVTEFYVITDDNTRELRADTTRQVEETDLGEPWYHIGCWIYIIFSISYSILISYRYMLYIHQRIMCWYINTISLTMSFGKSPHPYPSFIPIQSIYVCAQDACIPGQEVERCSCRFAIQASGSPQGGPISRGRWFQGRGWTKSCTIMEPNCAWLEHIFDLNGSLYGSL